MSRRDLVLIGLPLVVVVVAVMWMAVKLVRPAPPNTIRLLGGAEGSSYRTNAEKYKKIIEKYGVKVEILSSRGAEDNLRLLAAPKSKADAAFVQGGLTEGVDISRVVSLGTVFAQPVMVYYRAAIAPSGESIERLTELYGRRLAIGPEGSGTRALALKLLKANDMDEKDAVLIDLGGEEAANALIEGRVDAAFLMGDSATPKLMRKLRDQAGIAMMNFRQADGYTRRLRYLTRLNVPEGAFDLAKNYPPRPLTLVAPTVELVAREDLHPALSDLLIGAAREVHGGAGLFRNAGEYPTPVEREFPISSDAERYYKSGGQFLYKRLPFWMASLVDRLMVLLLPVLVLVVPATRVVPSIYRWRVRSRIYRWYGALMAIEREMMTERTAEQREGIIARLAEIERAVNAIRTPLAFADQLYVLRDHVHNVRRRLEPRTTLGTAA